MDEYLTVQDQQGWNDATMLELSLDFIRDSNMEERFVAYLRNRADLENGLR